MVKKTDMKQYADFIKEAEALKSTLRTAWAASGRRESTAEHSWRLALFAGILCCEFPELDRERVLMMCLVHDLGEIYSGDISAALRPDENEKFNQEKRDVERVTRFLGDKEAGREIIRLWEEYSAGSTAESRFVKALDKAETIIQHNQGVNPKGFDYEFNMQYGKDYFINDSRLRELRELIDLDTKQNI